MLAFATAITDEDRYAREALAGIRRVAPPGSPVLVRRGMALQDAYDAMIEEAVAIPGLAGLVLLHQDLELHDPAFADGLLTALAGDDVAIVGVQGRVGMHGLRELGSTVVGEVRSGSPFDRRGARGPAVEVEIVDGMLLALSPWALRELRFDRRLEPTFHLYDRDLCFQARAAGKRVLCLPTDATHHFRRGALESREGFVEAQMALHRLWQAAPMGDDAPREL